MRIFAELVAFLGGDRVIVERKKHIRKFATAGAGGAGTPRLLTASLNTILVVGTLVVAGTRLAAHAYATLAGAARATIGVGITHLAGAIDATAGEAVGIGLARDGRTGTGITDLAIATVIVAFAHLADAVAADLAVGTIDVALARGAFWLFATRRAYDQHDPNEQQQRPRPAASDGNTGSARRTHRLGQY